MITFTISLDRPARKEGGDRYKGKCGGTEVVFYLPQTVTRDEAGEPIQSFGVTLAPEG